MKVVKFLILSALVFGCTAQSQVLINPSTRHKVDCSTWGFGIIGTPISIANYYKCINNYEALGYVPIEEHGGKKYSNFDTITDPEVVSCMNPIWTENTEWTYSTPNGKKSLKVQKKDYFKGVPVYSVLTDQGRQLMIDETLGLYAVLNQGTIEGEFIPPLHNYDWPLMVGKKWEYRATQKTPNGNLDVITFYEVQSYGKINVPAGVFDAYYIVGKNDTGLIKLIKLWYSPEVQYNVKTITYSQEGFSIEELDSFKKGE